MCNRIELTHDTLFLYINIMKHLHTKIKHHVREKKNRYLIGMFSIFLIFATLSSVFFFTKGSDPHTSELAFTERSSLGNGAGSVVPASCGSFDHGTTQTCWDGSVVSLECGTCPAIPPNDCAGIPGGPNYTNTCGNCGNPPAACPIDVGCGPGNPAPSGCNLVCGSTAVNDFCGTCGGGVAGPNACDLADAGSYYTDQCCTTACGGTRCGNIPVPLDCNGTPRGTAVDSGCGCGVICPASVNCVGYWADNAVCSVTGACGQTGTIQQTFTQTTAAANGGVSCTAIYGGENGATRSGATSCSTAACGPTPCPRQSGTLTSGACSYTGDTGSTVAVGGGYTIPISGPFGYTGSWAWSCVNNAGVGTWQPSGAVCTAPTGTWTAPTCPSACGLGASNPPYTCVGGNGLCSTNSPATLSCGATAACPSCTGTAPTGGNFTSIPATTGTYPWTYAPSGECTWSCNAGTTKVGTTCVPPTGTISASPNPCLIAEGATTCNTDLSWSTVNPTGISNVTKTGGSVVFNGNNSGTPQTTSVSGLVSSMTFFLNHIVTLDTVTVPVRCANGLYWSGAALGCTACGQTGCTGTGGDSSNPGGGLVCRNSFTVPLCLDAPTVSVTLNNSTNLFISHYAGNNPRIRWNGASGAAPASCSTSGNWTNASAVGSPYNSSALNVSVGPLAAGSVSTYTYSCTNGGGATLASANVDVCPLATPVLTDAIGSCQGLSVVGLSLTGNYTAAGVLRLTCTNSDRYTLRKNGSPVTGHNNVAIGSGVFVTTVNRGASDAGTYELECFSTSFDGHPFSDVNDSVITYSATAPNPIVTLIAAPASIARSSATVLTWTVMYPNSVQVPVRTPACKLSATPVCTGTCTAAQDNASTTVNTILRTAMTDSNDSNGSRPINPDAVNQLPPVRAVGDWRARGKKTIVLEKSMDFKLDCGSPGTKASSTVRVIVTSTNEG